LKKKPSGIALLVDPEAGYEGRGGVFTVDRSSMEEYVLKALHALGKRVTPVAFEPDVVSAIQRLRELNPALVFNITECLDGDRRHDHAIAATLDMLGVPYTGTGPVGMQLCRDKALSKQIVGAHGIAVPRFIEADSTAALRDHGLRFPIIVKPQFRDGSDDISKRALVADMRALRARVEALLRKTREPVICEEFIAGRDLYVAMLGNDAPAIMPPVELVIGRQDHAAAPRFATRHLKDSGSYRTRWRVRWRRAALDARLHAQVKQASRTIFRLLKLRDYARLDYRVTDDGGLFFIEANPNPDLHPHAMGMNRCFVGIEHTRLIARIVEIARRRARLVSASPKKSRQPSR
jgi:D-alanine-D-alanine ligase